MNCLQIEIRNNRGEVLSPVYEVHNLADAFSILGETEKLAKEQGAKIEGFQLA